MTLRQSSRGVKGVSPWTLEGTTRSLLGDSSYSEGLVKEEVGRLHGGVPLSARMGSTSFRGLIAYRGFLPSDIEGQRRSLEKGMSIQRINRKGRN